MVTELPYVEMGGNPGGEGKDRKRDSTTREWPCGCDSRECNASGIRLAWLELGPGRSGHGHRQQSAQGRQDDAMRSRSGSPSCSALCGRSGRAKKRVKANVH
jgi:hypothetical protein